MTDSEFLRQCAEKDYLNMNMRMQMKKAIESMEKGLSRFSSRSYFQSYRRTPEASFR